jgi:type I restriction enzyme S subunit
MKAGWQTSTLGDVLAVIRNGVNCKQDKSGNGDRISHIESISDAIFDLDKVGYAELSERDKEKNRLQPGDILFSHINSAVHVGKTAVFDCDEPVYHGVNLLLMRPKEVVTSAYLDHALKYLFQSGYWRGVCKQSVNQASVNQQDISRVEIRYPKSLAEQQRIVGLLDEAFEGLATAKANAEKNLQNARALFESHLQSVFTQRGPGWVETTLSRATDGIFTGPFGSLLHKSDYIADGIPLVNPAHITEVGIEPDLRKTVSKATALRLKNYIMREGDIVIGRRGEMGRCALVTEVEDGWLCGTGSFFIKPSSRCDTRYLVRFLRSDSCKARLEKIAGGAVMPNLSNTDLGNFAFDLPPLDRQKAIVEEIDSLHEETQRLARLYERKHAALEALKKSLLHQAFTGEL